ncbi:TPA: hypothetical protein L3932_006663 [Pseudomonas aeruginosa]|nr:hypothetical protein [Pseudomonas aeruginosa]HBN9886219.1 hypothetical protein [Pseudomonas aeruginosa]
MNVGFYSDRGQLLDESRISCSRAEYHLEDLAREAQDLANECRCTVVAWIRSSRDEAAEAEQRTDKLEADAKRFHEIEELLLPLRKLYASYSQRHDYGGKEALEAAVLRALRRRPAKTA